MRTTLKHEGLDFQVFDPGSVAHSKAQIKQQAASGIGTIIRKVRLFQIYEASLHRTLTTADAVFENIAAACGARVVEHVWGLYPTSDHNSLYDELGVTPHLPEGYDVAAHIKVVPDLRPLPPSGSHFNLVHDTLMHHREDKAWPKWWDASSYHFEVTSDPSTENDTLYLVDIEPLIEIDPSETRLFLSRR